MLAASAGLGAAAAAAVVGNLVAAVMVFERSEEAVQRNGDKQAKTPHIADRVRQKRSAPAAAPGLTGGSPDATTTGLACTAKKLAMLLCFGCPADEGVFAFFIARELQSDLALFLNCSPHFGSVHRRMLLQKVHAAYYKRS